MDKEEEGEDEEEQDAVVMVLDEQVVAALAIGDVGEADRVFCDTVQSESGSWSAVVEAEGASFSVATNSTPSFKLERICTATT